MLKTASIFKDFRISVNADNTAVTFYKVAEITASVKNDNFATQVQILDNADTTDLFDYKYITFDDSAVFEIKDCIKNEKYTTLFIQYLSNITFGTENNNFRVDGVSVSKLQYLGLNVNQLFEILGNNINFDIVNYQNTPSTIPNNFIFAIKLRFSEMPQNLNKRFLDTGFVTDATNNFTYGNNIFNPPQSHPDTKPAQFNQTTSTDNAVTVIIPMPILSNSTTELYFVNGDITKYYRYDLQSFINTLSVLITNITLSAEVVLFSKYTLAFVTGIIDDVKYIDMENVYFTLPIFENDTQKNAFLNLIRVPSNLVTSNQTTAAPCFLINGSANAAIVENLEYFKVILPTREANEIFVSMRFLGNDIDISNLKNDYIYIKRYIGKMRVYVDIEKNIYTDIITTLEFAKNAYSNYEAYQKANIELVNNQNNAALQQQQQQKRDLQTVSSVTSGVNTAIGAVSQFASGNIAGGITGLLSGGINIASEQIKFNMQQQNERANNKLAAAQALERARGTITPSSDLNGSINLATAIYSELQGATSTARYLHILKITLTDMQLYSVQKYIFDNLITEKITDITQITKPEWQTLFNYYQIKITNRSAINTRKDLIIFAEDAAE